MRCRKLPATVEMSRMRFCRGIGCGLLFFVCVSCDRGQSTAPLCAERSPESSSAAQRGVGTSSLHEAGTVIGSVSNGIGGKSSRRW
jgi:hypothetical protein